MDEQNLNDFCGIGKRIDNPNKHNWESLSLDNLKFERPTVLCLSGDGTVTFEDANGFAKIAENYLQLLFKAKDPKTGEIVKPTDKVDILSVKYANNILSQEAKQQIANCIFALLVDENGNRLELEQAKKNMSQLTFFTFCYGHSCLFNIIQKVNVRLQSAGYGENEISAISNACFELCYGHISGVNNIPSVRIHSKEDETFFTEAPLYNGTSWKYLDGILLRKNEPGNLNGLSGCVNATAPSIQIESSKLINLHPEMLDEHGVEAIKLNKDFNLEPYIDAETGAAYSSPNAKCVAQMAAWALCKGVENSVQNFESDKYVPNTYYNDLMGDFKSIMDSFKQRELLKDYGKKQNQDLGIER